ncbi:52 kDa repressor of the inhibitor of the protein kinase [Nephila pilipes]|uniref:52 kDa repressor of the inhibitor of the protein kinase n=1 Tax=Nephila pilipes TaxID=299642 RepID=A0A8X6T020_NEPPI|nr:52 kDa repressor of the inhibitor of the protein kinase [Nephila pilipes]
MFRIKEYFKNYESLAATVRKFRTKYDRNSDLTLSIVKRAIEKFRQTGSIGDVEHIGRPKTSRSNVNIETVRENVGESQGTLIWGRGQELQISRNSLQRIFIEDLCLHAHKVQLTQELKL